MTWVLQSPQIHSTFSSLGFLHADGYHVNENCNGALETILHNILTEDKYLRTYRRSISCGQNISKDLIPLLIHTKDDRTVELLIRILVNLTIPIECLLAVEVISKTDFGRHTIFEINNLLTTTKIAFTDHRATRVIIDFLRKNVESEHKTKLLPDQCLNISNSLLLLRNIFHIPEDNYAHLPSYCDSSHIVQNQILWNVFSQSIDKVLIKLMSVPDACYWGVTMVQFIALLYKDQHVTTLHKLVNVWLEASLSESSEDNESNTSPPDRGSEDSSPMLTSDPTSDSSETGGSRKSSDEPNSINNDWEGCYDHNSEQNCDQHFEINQTHLDDQMNCMDHCLKFDNDTARSFTSGIQSEQSDPSQNKSKTKNIISEPSDCGYGTQIENHESFSTSSNEDNMPAMKPVYQKPHNPKLRPKITLRSHSTFQERKRRRIVKRGRSNIINVQGLTHNTPTDDDIANVLKEFTVDFLLKGYNSLVHTLHNEILTNAQLEIDTSHFFWLVTYFLKFATQIELGLEHVGSVLSFEIVSYLTAEAVNLCEQFELATRLDGNDLTPTIRRQHLVVTAIREFVQAIDVYKKLSYMSDDDQQILIKLQVKMCETDELRSLLVLLLRHYNPKYHTLQYLQDLIVTNHILLMFLDSTMKLPEYTSSASMVDHMRQFATPEIMYQYGLLLEDYCTNGEFVNDCIFTVMHHVGGDLGSLITLFQPRILKTFTSIWKSEFDVCDDWSDLIEYVINTFIKKPQTLRTTPSFLLDEENFDENNVSKLLCIAPAPTNELNETESKPKAIKSSAENTMKERWTEDEVSSLSWTYMRCNTLPDAIGEIIKMLKEDGIIKSRDSIITELLKQNIINKDKYDNFVKGENDRNCKTIQKDKEIMDDEISKLCEELKQDGKSNFLEWVQQVLLDTCYAKIYIAKKKLDKAVIDQSKLLNFELFKRKADDLPVISPVSYHAIMLSEPTPLVTWNCEQATIIKDLKFLQLLDKLGFLMPVESGKIFIRIPNIWTADFLYNVAGKIMPIDTTKLRFSVNEFAQTSAAKPGQEGLIFSNVHKEITVQVELNNCYQVHKQKHLATMVNFTPKPGCSYSSGASEIDNQNWLKVVQKSQEIKLTIDFKSLEKIEEESDVSMLPPNKLVPAAAMRNNADDAKLMAAPLARPSRALPAIMTVKQEVSTFSIPVADTDYFSSICESAPVASDLDNMYVSDEDEKPESPLAPSITRGLRGPRNLPPGLRGPSKPGKRSRDMFSAPF